MFLKHTLWPILWALLIFVVCGIPGEDIPKISFLETIHFDKFVHLALFFVLVLLTARGFNLQSTFLKLQQHPRFAAFIISIIYGGFIEILQETFFEQRSGDILDFMADSIGATLGLLIYKPLDKVLG